MSGRTPCINPSCKRTAPADKFPEEMICGKCFRKLPEPIKNDFRFAWRQYRRWERRISRTSDELKLQKMHSIIGMWGRRIDAVWETIKATIANPEQPEGLDVFLKDMGF